MGPDKLRLRIITEGPYKGRVLAKRGCPNNTVLSDVYESAGLSRHNYGQDVLTRDLGLTEATETVEYVRADLAAVAPISMEEREILRLFSERRRIMEAQTKSSEEWNALHVQREAAKKRQADIDAEYVKLSKELKDVEKAIQGVKL